MLVCPQPVKNMPPARAARPVHGPSVGSRTGVVLEWRCVGVDLVHLQFCMWWEAHSGPRRCLDLGGALGRERDRVRNTVRSLIPKCENFERIPRLQTAPPGSDPRARRTRLRAMLRAPDTGSARAPRSWRRWADARTPGGGGPRAADAPAS